MTRQEKALSLKKYRKKRNRKKGRAAVAVAAVMGAVIIAGLCVGLIPRVTEVKATGTSYYTDADIERILFGEGRSRAPLVVFLNDLFGKNEEIPFVESYKVKLTGLTSVKVYLTAKSMVGYVEFMGSNLVFDRDGLVVESSRDVYPDIPKVTGLRINSVVLGQTLPVESKSVLSELLQISQFLAATNITWNGEDMTLINLVDRIHFDSNESISCYVGDVSVVLGTGYNLESKLREMADILPSLFGRKGTLHLEGFNVSDNNRVYRFEEDEN
ncbi:MAG: hypothetical protein IJU01_04385 [Lachnospiraceae bacterium]|nr:hypothetical protein [Lachnospiraceae bacterium]MBR6270988.1 hypothetical protein [Lachnospiraceae bacterium]